MNNLDPSRAEKKTKETNKTISLKWIDNPGVQELLDVVISIIAEEYIEIATHNPNIFTKKEVFK
ncbi:MAG: hypothetical protein MUP98_14660 [Candidatus Aminicenantes bacterium]|nr:hypothetical protein [Candidatus Aminicenantes bacterium]